MGRPAASEIGQPPPGRLRRIVQKIWWLHSFGALSVGVGVMLFARHGLAYADKLLMVLLMSWLLMFGALRFIVGPANRTEGERFTKKGVRFVTNYVIKQLYQQMFFFLVPLYATSATWSLSSFNWWLAPLLLLFAVLSTMDLVFDNFIMERRVLASFMYGIAMFGVLNVILPLVTGMPHFAGLMIAAGATPPAVALLSFRARTVFSLQGASLTVAVTVGALGGAFYGRAFVPPAPISLLDDSVGQGAEAELECLPAAKRFIRRVRATQLRCGSLITEPGGIKEPIFHEWRGPGVRIVKKATTVGHCDEASDVGVYVSWLFDRPEAAPGHDATGATDSLESSPRLPAPGKWKCITRTEHGQVIGVRTFTIVADKAAPAVLPRDVVPPAESHDAGGAPKPTADAGPGTGAGAPDDSDVARGPSDGSVD